MKKSVYQWMAMAGFLCAAFSTNAQLQNVNWRFAYNGGLNFGNGGDPTTVVGETFTPEGGASVSDRTTGALLFYTDGNTLWNANNAVMQNGTGLLGGSPSMLSSTTAASIVRDPASETRYWVFTIDEQGSANGLRYSIVDMTLDGGLGGVVQGQKNIALFNTLSEKLAIIPNAANTGYWVITHDNQESFYVYALTGLGLNNTPIVSNVTSPQFNGAGHFKMNRTFDMLAMGSLFEGSIGLYPFDNATGTFSAPVEWSYTFGTALQYGMEFSPNGQVLYVSNLERIIQYDISSGDPATIQASAYLVFQGDFFSGTPASLQLAMDRRIYCNLGGGIGRIDCPNFTGAACNWSSNAIPGYSTGGYGLNPWVYDISAPEIPLVASLSFGDNCAQEPIAFALDVPIAFDEITVDWGDGTTETFAQNTNNISRTYANAGDYLVSVEITAACELIAFDTLITVLECTPQIPEIVSLAVQGDTCSITNALSFVAQLNGTFEQLIFDFGDAGVAVATTTVINASSVATAQHVFSAPGIYNVCVRGITEGLQDTTVCLDITVGLCCEFNVQVEGNCTELPASALVTGTNAVDAYTWSITAPSGTVINSEETSPELALPEAGVYQWEVILTGECGSVTLQRTLQRDPCEQEFCAPFIANAMTPNNDGLNEIFAPVFACGEVDYRLKIFNRWGDKLYDSENTNRGWNGGGSEYYVSDGVYFYVVEYPSARGIVSKVSGHVTVLR